MKRNKLRGVAIIEFSFAMMLIVPLLLGTIGIGVELVQSMQTIQLSRDAGHMYASGLDFSQPGNRTVLASLGADVGLHTAVGDTGGTAVVILSTVKYMDDGACPLGLASCGNYKWWVFVERIVIGNNNYRTSNMGSPLTSGVGRVTIDSNTGKISIADQKNNSNDRAYFSATGNPFVNALNAGTLNNLPSGQVLYVAEAASKGFTLPPFAKGGMLYAYNVF